MRLCSSEFPYRIFDARNESDISIGGSFIEDKYKDDVVRRDDTKAFGNVCRRNEHCNETDGNKKRDEHMVLRIGSESLSLNCIKPIGLGIALVQKIHRNTGRRDYVSPKTKWAVLTAIRYLLGVQDDY